MGERNDLIERRWIGVVPSGLQGPAKVTRLERVAEIWRNQGLFVTEWVPATTIATLSEALAEAEKKGAEDEGALAKAIFQADYPTDKWERFARGDVVDERYRLLARAALAHIFPPRDLSQGGQHG